ncbi:MAG: PfkB family carbohydrate kinase [Thaumarchaeota archaeon]|nr:PfkB family carbohydrate kinase [Nitrososphaerota archaeon]
METKDEKSFSILVAGHIVVDEIIDTPDQTSPRRALGGAPSYSSIALSSLGYNPEIVTRVGSDFPDDYASFLKKKSGMEVGKWLASGFKTTRYRIDRTGEHRRMWLLAKCKDLTYDDFRPFISDSSSAKALVINPVAGEISLSLLERVSKEFDHVFIDSQGFVRKFDKNTGELGMRSGLDISALAGVDVLKTDLEELSAWVGTSNKESAIRQLSRFVSTLLLTSGPGAVEVYEQGTQKLRAIPFMVDVSDTTGAGDIMMSTFAARYMESGNLEEALKFAVTCSTLAIKNYGIEKAILSKLQVETEMKRVEIRK